MKDSIILSEKHGVNPSIMVCPICGKDTGIALLGKLPKDEQAPKYIQGEMCEDCKKLSEKDYTFAMTVDENKHPCGEVFRLKSEVAQKMFDLKEHHPMVLIDREIRDYLCKCVFED